MTNTTTRRKASHFIAVLAAIGLIAAACGGGSESQPSTEDAVEQTTTVTTVTTVTTTTTTISAEEIFGTPDEDAAEASTEDHEEEVEGFEEVEPIPQEVICGEGLTLMEEFVTDTDNGCRPEMCDHGRDHHGDCALPPADEPMTEEEVAELPTETIPQEEYGLEGCTEVSLGVCDLEGVLFCHDTVEGWTECPGQPSGDPCEHDESDPLSFAGSTQSQPESVTLPAGVWAVSVCLTNNNVRTGQPEPFLVNMIAVNNDGRLYRLVPTETAVDGLWEQTIEAPDGLDRARLSVTPEGDGSWVITFTPSG